MDKISDINKKIPGETFPRFFALQSTTNSDEWNPFQVHSVYKYTYVVIVISNIMFDDECIAAGTVTYTYTLYTLHAEM